MSKNTESKKRKVCFAVETAKIKKLVEKIESRKRFNYMKIPKGKKPYVYPIVSFAYSEKQRPYKDPESIIRAVIDQEVERFVTENMWQDLYDARNFRRGKLKKMPNSVHSQAALEIYDAYVFFKKERKVLERKVDRLLNAWAKIFRQKQKMIEKEYKAEGKPVKGFTVEEEITTSTGKKRKVKFHRSPWADSFNREGTQEEKDAMKALHEAEDELALANDKHYKAVIANLGHLWI